MNPLASLITGIVSPITGYFKKRDENKTEIKKKHIQRVINADDQIAEWEAIQAESGKHSWKDEFWTIVLSLPAIGAFMPSAVPHITAGFTALATMPDFFQYWLGVAILTSFGVRITKR